MTPFLALLVALPSSNDGQWGATSMTPLALARGVDEKLATLRQTKLSYFFTYVKKSVGSGYDQCEGSILEPGRFFLKVPIVDPKAHPVVNEEWWVSDGRRYGQGLHEEPFRIVPLGQRPAGPASPVNAWFSNFSRVILSGVGRRSHPLQNLVVDAARQKFSTVAQMRVLAFQGKRYTQHRLVLVKGLARYEIDVDGHFMLPTGVVNFVGSNDNTRWSAVRWDFPRKPIDPKVISFRTPKVVTPSAGPPRR